MQSIGPCGRTFGLGTPDDRGLDFDPLAGATGRARHVKLMNQKAQGLAGSLTRLTCAFLRRRRAYADRTRTHNGVKPPRSDRGAPSAAPLRSSCRSAGLHELRARRPGELLRVRLVVADLELGMLHRRRRRRRNAPDNGRMKEVRRVDCERRSQFCGLPDFKHL